MSENHSYYTPVDASRALGVHRVTIHRWIRDGRVRTELVAGLHLIPASEVERLREELKKEELGTAGTA